MMHKLHHKHRNILFLFLGFAFAIFLSTLPAFKNFLVGLGNYGYIGAFIGGLMFDSVFTIPTGTVILVNLSKTLSIPLLVLVGGIGAVICDFIIFKFVKDDVEDEIEPIFEELVGKSHLHKLMHTKYFSWTLPVLGALIIASPLPDELGVSLLGISEINTARFLLISWCSNTVGITTLVSAFHFLHA